MIDHVQVSFRTEDGLLQKLFDGAQEKLQGNIRDFSGRQVLIEGGGYEKIWLETQPMGGEMYAKRNMMAALNNQLLFMEHIREDGRLPGSIALLDDRIRPEFNKFQGFCFPAPALNVYYLSGKDPAYLDLLYDSLERFDAYLWRVRDSDGDGCLESWCRYDTGEDHALRYGDAPDAWDKEYPPRGCSVVPMASLDVMSYSYSARDILGDISRIKNKGRWEKEWREKAKAVQNRIKARLWNEERGACFDRDNKHRMLPTLTHQTLRGMYWKSVTREMARSFVIRHLLNEREFWTNMPLPSVSAEDPLFRNIDTNNWSGQPEALTYQRAIRALENYGYDYLLPHLGRKLFSAIGEDGIFVQQYDPFIMAPSRICLEGEQDAYGPAMLSVLEYISRCHGIHMEREQIYWGCLGGFSCEYKWEWGESVFRLESNGKKAAASINGRLVFEANDGLKVVTDLQGRILRIVSLVTGREHGVSDYKQY